MTNAKLVNENILVEQLPVRHLCRNLGSHSQQMSETLLLRAHKSAADQIQYVGAISPKQVRFGQCKPEG